MDPARRIGRLNMANEPVKRPAERSAPWQQVRGRAREWWGRLTDGDLDRSRQFDRFIATLQERYGLSRERAVKVLRRRMLKRRASQPRAVD
jgi:uncharacterized protein YjbJ (UPF0337 family)